MRKTSTTVIGAALALLSLAAPASSQRPTAAPAGPQAVVTNFQPLPAFPVALGGAEIALPHLRSHCGMNAQEVAQVASSTSAFAPEGARLIGISADCQVMRKLRSGQPAELTEMMMYVARDAAPPSADKRRSARAECDEARTTKGFTTLRSEKPQDRLSEVESLVQGGAGEVQAVIESTQRACYVASTVKQDGGGISMVIAATQIKGRSIWIMAVAPNGTDLRKLRQRAGTVVEAMSRQNGEG